MAKQYQWRAATKYASTTSLSYGVTPSDKTDWQTADIGTGGSSQTWTWWFRDSNTMSGGTYTDAISSRVAVQITESWTTSVDERNYLTVTVNVTIDSVVRDDLRGSDQNTPGRLIDFYTSEGGGNVLSLADYQIATAHTIYAGPLVVQQFSFTLAPGENLEHSSIYLHNQAVGYSSYDDIWMGVQFRNILPADYRPGAVQASGWKSTDRSGGACNIKSGNSWREMRTIYGAEETNKPPKIRHSNGTWYNQRKVGSG